MFKKRILWSAFTCAFMLTATAAVAAAKTPEEHVLTVGKQGEIILTQPTKVADQLLQPASYIVQHRNSDTEHFVRFLKAVSLKREEDDSHYTEHDNVGEIKCRLVATSEPATETKAYLVMENGEPRITKVAIKGESALHLF